MTIIVCGTRRKHIQRCKYCSRPATAVCAFVNIEETPCQAAICGQCDDWGNCRIHRLRGDKTIQEIPAGNITEKTNEQA